MQSGLKNTDCFCPLGSVEAGEGPVGVVPGAPPPTSQLPPDIPTLSGLAITAPKEGLEPQKICFDVEDVTVLCLKNVLKMNSFIQYSNGKLKRFLQIT
jgi:hypothetical protein